MIRPRPRLRVPRWGASGCAIECVYDGVLPLRPRAAVRGVGARVMPGGVGLGPVVEGSGSAGAGDAGDPRFRFVHPSDAGFQGACRALPGSVERLPASCRPRRLRGPVPPATMRSIPVPSRSPPRPQLVRRGQTGPVIAGANAAPHRVQNPRTSTWRVMGADRTTPRAGLNSSGTDVGKACSRPDRSRTWSAIDPALR